MTKVIAVIAMLVTTSALAESPYPTPTRDGRQRIQRTGTCPTGYVGKGDFCEALQKDTPAAMPKIKGAAPARPATSPAATAARHSDERDPRSVRRPEGRDGAEPLCARRTVVASYLYYRHDLSMMSDPEFDDICQRAAKNRGRLDPLRQFMLGSPGEIRASGFHVKVTVFAESAAYEWMRQNREKPNARQGRHHRVAIRRNTSTSLGRSLCSMRHIVWPIHCSNCGTKMGYVADSCPRPALYCLSCEPTEDEDEDRC